MPRSGLDCQLYCMQTQAIQQYALHVDRCRPAGSEGTEIEAVVGVGGEEEEGDNEARRTRKRRRRRLRQRQRHRRRHPRRLRALLTPTTPNPATPSMAPSTPSGKLLTPGELMSMAAAGAPPPPLPWTSKPRLPRGR